MATGQGPRQGLVFLTARDADPTSAHYIPSVPLLLSDGPAQPSPLTFFPLAQRWDLRSGWQQETCIWHTDKQSENGEMGPLVP